MAINLNSSSGNSVVLLNGVLMDVCQDLWAIWQETERGSEAMISGSSVYDVCNFLSIGLVI